RNADEQSNRTATSKRERLSSLLQLRRPEPVLRNDRNRVQDRHRSGIGDSQPAPGYPVDGPSNPHQAPGREGEPELVVRPEPCLFEQRPKVHIWIPVVFLLAHRGVRSIGTHFWLRRLGSELWAA